MQRALHGTSPPISTCRPMYSYFGRYRRTVRSSGGSDAAVRLRLDPGRLEDAADARGSHRRLAEPDARCVVEGVRHGPGDRRRAGLAGAGGDPPRVEGRGVDVLDLRPLTRIVDRVRA